MKFPMEVVRFKNINKNYVVATDGTVWRVKKNGDISMIKPLKHKNGRLFVFLSVDGKKSIKFVHKLVLETFVGKFEKKIYFKDGDITNVSLSNLFYY